MRPLHLLLRPLVFILMFTLSAEAQEIFEDFMFPALPGYAIDGQTRMVTTLTLYQETDDPEHINEISVTGNCVATYYLHPDEEENHPNRIDIAVHYERAMRPYSMEILFKDEYNMHGRFFKEDSEYYFILQIYSRGREYETIILEKLL